MPTLKDSCQELQQRLAQVEGQCQDTSNILLEFEGHVSSYIASRLIRKLRILAAWIIARAEALYKEHEGEGHVCVFFSKREGITLHWVERKEIVADRAWFVSHGLKVVSVPEAAGTIAQMADELASDNWAKVVDWLNNYGKFPGLDFTKFS
jgi:hypothetical protein